MWRLPMTSLFDSMVNFEGFDAKIQFFSSIILVFRSQLSTSQ